MDQQPIRERVDEMQALLERVQRDNGRIAALVIELREAAHRVEQLSAYYLSEDWAGDREHVRGLDGVVTPPVLSEDAAWGAIADNETGVRHLVYTCARQLVRQANGSLHDLVPEPAPENVHA